MTRRFGIAVGLLLFVGPAMADKQGEIFSIGSTPRLLVDDVLLARKEGVVRHIHACTKLPEPVMVADKPWEQEGDDKRLYIYGTVVRDAETGRFRMWYNRLRLVLLAESEDGIHWARPELGLQDWAGSKANNIVLTDLHSPSVVHNPAAEDPEYRYAMIGAAKGYRAFHSPDGLHWRSISDEPVLVGGDTCTLAYDASAREYLAFHKRSHEYLGQQRRLVYLSTSRDLKAWSEPKLVMAPDEDDDEQVKREGGQYSQFYNMSAFSCGGQFLGMVTHFRYSGPTKEKGPEQSGQDGPIDVQLVHSRDGRNWSRCEDRFPVIPNGPCPYDAGCILGVANGPVIVGDEYWLYYTAITTTHGGALPEKRVSIALAKWRLDGFVSLDAGKDPGVVETVPLRLSAGCLIINADVRGTLTVALLNSEGMPIPRFGHEDCVAVKGDSLRHRVSWKEDVHLPVDVPVRLQFRMREARLFSLSVRPD